MVSVDLRFVGLFFCVLCVSCYSSVVVISRKISSGNNSMLCFIWFLVMVYGGGSVGLSGIVVCLVLLVVFWFIFSG